MRKLALIALVLGLFVVVTTAAAQPPHTCGSTVSVEFVRVDNAGYAPKAYPGSETVFNCIAARDPNFAAQRFGSAWEAFNYWIVLYGQEIGVSLIPLPAPTH